MPPMVGPALNEPAPHAARSLPPADWGRYSGQAIRPFIERIARCAAP
jgi:hypothetical protein